MKRQVTIDEAVAIMDAAMNSRAVTDEARTVWRMLRAELSRLQAILKVIERIKS